MASLSPNKQYAVPTVNADNNVWGGELNSTLTQIDLNLGGSQTVSLAAGSVVASVTQAATLITTLNGALTGATEYILPAGYGGLLIFNNQTTGAFTATVASSGGGSSVVVPPGQTMALYSDGTNIVDATTAIPSTIPGPLTISTGPVTITSGNMVLTDGSLILNDGGISMAIGSITLTLGGITLTNGSIAMTAGNLTLSSGNLTLDNGSAAVTGGGITSTTNFAQGITSIVTGAAVIGAFNANIADYSTQTLAQFFLSSTPVGSISYNGTNTVYGTTSDARLKEATGDFDAGLCGRIVDRLKPRWFRWRSEAGAAPQPGFFAQEMHRVFPWAVRVGQGRPGTRKFRAWETDVAKLMPVVVAELQFLRRRVAELEAAAHGRSETQGRSDRKRR